MKHCGTPFQTFNGAERCHDNLTVCLRSEKCGLKMFYGINKNSKRLWSGLQNIMINCITCLTDN